MKTLMGTRPRGEGNTVELTVGICGRRDEGDAAKEWRTRVRDGARTRSGYTA